jgi:hypothetical protein
MMMAGETALTLYDLLKGKRIIPMMPVPDGDERNRVFSVNYEFLHALVGIEVVGDWELVRITTMCVAQGGPHRVSFEIPMEEFRFNPPAHRLNMPIAPDLFRERYSGPAMKEMAKHFLLPDFAVPEECVYGM